jgi:hypothetical protein
MTTTSHRIPRFALLRRLSIASFVTTGMVVSGIAHAQQSSAEDAASVQPFVSDTTFLVVKVESAGIGLPDIATGLGALSSDIGTAYGPVWQRVAAGVEQFRALVNNQPVYATFGIPISTTRIPAYVFMKQPSGETAARLTHFLKKEMKTELHVHGDHAVIRPLNGLSVEELLDSCPTSSREGIQDAFESVVGFPIQVLLLPPAHVWRTVAELSPELPPQLGGGPSSVLTEGVQWAALGVDPAKMRAEVILQSKSDVAARNLATHLPKMLRSTYRAVPDLHKQIPKQLSEAIINWIKPTVKGRRIVIPIDGLEKTSANLKLLAALAGSIDEKANRHRDTTKFKQIMLAMHNYHDANKVFPPHDKYRGKDGKHRLSWRVHILPYVEQRQLYDQFHLDEPWDSPHNKRLIEKMPDIYRSRSIQIPPKAAVKPGYTTFLAPVGDNTVFGQAKATTFSTIIDGTSNTGILLEVKPDKAVPWTAPQDYDFDPKTPFAGIHIGSDGVWLCAFADGSVHRLRGDIPAEMVVRVFEVNDRSPIDHKKIH